MERTPYHTIWLFLVVAVVVCFAGGADARRSLLQTTCANPALPNVDLPSYLGVWYEIGSTALIKSFTEQNLACITARYSLIEANTIRVRNEGYNTSSGEFSTILGTATVTNRTLTVSFGGPVADYRIIYVSGEAREKYETAIVYSCDGEAGGFQSLYVLSRKPQLDDDTPLPDLLTFAASQGITLEPNNQLVLTPQDAITCGRNID
nr:lipocalin-like protein [Physcomitrium patens]